MNDYEIIGGGFATYGEKLEGISPRENYLMAYKHLVPKTVPNLFVDAGYFWAVSDLERYSGTDRGKDMFGVEWQYEPEVFAPMPIGDPILEDIADWKEVVRFPDLEAIDWEQAAYDDLHTDMGAWMAGQGVHPLADGASCMDGGKAGVCIIMNGMFERLHALMSFEEALFALASDPESCFEFFSAMADFKIAYIKKIAEYYPVDVIQCHDDYGAGDRLFMSLPMWRELIKPNLKRIVDATHELGLFYQHHSCGYIEPLIPELVEIGVDAIDPLMGSCNPNLKEIKEAYGDRLTFCGGFDNVNVLDNLAASDDEKKAEFRRTLDALAPGGSYVVFPGGLGLSTTQTLAEYFQYGADFYARERERRSA